MDRPAPTRAAHAKFCEIEQWTRVRDATGRTGTHHVTYELQLTDGRILRTSVSRPPDRTTCGRGMWRHILRDQLDVDEETFWTTVRQGTVQRHTEAPAPGQALPTDLVRLLADRVGLSRTEIAAMPREQAIERINRFWTEGS